MPEATLLAETPAPAVAVSAAPATNVTPAIVVPAAVVPAAVPAAPVVAAAAPVKAAEPMVPIDSEPSEIVYDIKLGEKPTLDAKGLETLIAFAKDAKLSPEQAQQLASRDDAMLASMTSLQQAAIAKQTADWEAAAKADPEIGGEKLAAAQQKAVAALQKYGNPEMLEVLKGPYGNFPPLIKFLAKIGAAMSEDKLITSAQPASPALDGGWKATAHALYGPKTSG